MTVFRMTLTPNRSPGPPRRASIIAYRRRGDVVEAYRVTLDAAGVPSAEQIPIRSIGPCEIEPEFARQWMQHLARQERTHTTLAERRAARDCELAS